MQLPVGDEYAAKFGALDHLPNLTGRHDLPLGIQLMFRGWPAARRRHLGLSKASSNSPFGAPKVYPRGRFT
jgi:hypothetical protein